jgi:MFS family permease
MDQNTEPENIVPSHLSGLRRFRLLQPLADRNFFLLWLGESVSVFGTQFQALAMTWVVLDVLKAPGLALGTLMMAAAIPRAVFMLFGGVLSDRLSPRRVMLVSNASQCFLVAGLAFLVFAHTRGAFTLELWPLYVFSVIFGTVGAFFLPAMMTMIPRLLGKEKLEAGNALVMGTAQLGGLLGPAAAGVVVAAVGTAAAFGVDSVTFALATVALLLMKGLSLQPQPTRDSETAPAEPVKPDSALTDIRNGFRYAWGQPEIRTLLPVILVINLCFAGPVGVGLPKLIHGLTGEATSLGVVMAVLGGGSLLGSFLAGLLKLRHRGVLLTGVTGVFGTGLILLGWAPNVLSISLLVGVMGVGIGVVNVALIAWFQRLTRPDMLGRVMSLILFASVGLQPVSLALAGWLVDVNPTLMFAGAGTLVLLASLYLAVNRTVRAID